MINKLTLFLALLTIHSLSLAAVTASVDRNPITFGESFTLNISKQGSATAEPDLRLLEIAFRVINTTQSTQMQMGGGRSSHTTNWQIQLMPKAEGNITIPAIKVGDEKTQPINLMVKAPSSDPAQQAERGFILQGSLDKASVYPGEQATYTVKLLYNIKLQGNITAPSAANAVIEKLGDDINSRETIGNKRFQVVEQKYAVFPEQPGQLEISGALFNGQTESKNNNNPFGGMGMFRQMRPISAAATNSYLQVKPIPKTFAGTHWLAAEQVTLSDNLSTNSGELEVGQSFTRQLVIRAKGKLGTQLPDMSLAPVAGLKFYPEPAQTESRANGSTVTGMKTISIAIVPTSAGSIDLPEITLHWWDIKQNKQRTAAIPKRTLQVKASSTSASAPAPEIATVDSEDNPIVKTETIVDRGPWPWLTALFAALWALTLVGFYWLRHNQPNTDAPTSEGRADVAPQKAAQLLNTLKTACENGQVDEAAELLRQYGQQKLGVKLPNALALIPYVSTDLGNEVKALDACRYGANTAQWHGEKLMQAVRNETWKASAQAAQHIAKAKPIAALYQ